MQHPADLLEAAQEGTAVHTESSEPAAAGPGMQ